jgi:hypothetical protein
MTPMIVRSGRRRRPMIPRIVFRAEPDPAHASGGRVVCRDVAPIATTAIGRLIIDGVSQRDKARDEVKEAVLASFPAAWREKIFMAGPSGDSEYNIELWFTISEEAALAIGRAFERAFPGREITLNQWWPLAEALARSATAHAPHRSPLTGRPRRSLGPPWQRESNVLPAGHRQSENGRLAGCFGPQAFDALPATVLGPEIPHSRSFGSFRRGGRLRRPSRAVRRPAASSLTTMSLPGFHITEVAGRCARFQGGLVLPSQRRLCGRVALEADVGC